MDGWISLDVTKAPRVYTSTQIHMCTHAGGPNPRTDFSLKERQMGRKIQRRGGRNDLGEDAGLQGPQQYASRSQPGWHRELFINIYT